MSQENVEIVRRVYEQVSAHVWEASPDLFDPEYEVDLTDAYPDVRVIRSVGETALREYFEMFENFSVELKEVIHADEKHVVTAVRDGGRLKGSDAEVWNRFFHVWTFCKGKITRRSSHSERSQALKAAGLEE
jgi:ketosteroid isomerase-like protein